MSQESTTVTNPSAIADELGTAEEEVGIIDRPFDPEKINVKTEPKSLDLILKRIKHGEIDLAPEFQRRARIWPLWKKSQLIESLLLRIPLPVFYVSAAKNDDWAVVDGLQRLTTISDYVDNEFELHGLEYLKQMEGRHFEALPRQFKRRIEETTIVIHIIEPGTPEDVMINIFKRLNTGGEPLTAQEIRNALVKGPVREFLRQLAIGEAFRQATDGTVGDIRLEAEECVARFCAFFLKPYGEYLDGDFDGFILGAMQAMSAMSNSQRQELEGVFNRAMDAATRIFGRYAFRKFFEVEGRRGPISKALFDATSVNLARLSDAAVDALAEQRDDVLAAVAHLMSTDEEFRAAISASTGDRRRVAKRFGAIATLLAELAR